MTTLRAPAAATRHARVSRSTSLFSPGRLRLTAPVIAVAALILGPVALADAQLSHDPFVSIEVWSELDPLVADGGQRPVPREVVVERLLDEAAYVLSGMIYGFRFDYVPADPTRGVAEFFELEPYATIVRGDPRLTVFQTWEESDRLYARIYYTIDRAQYGWFRGWRSVANAASSGTGTAPFVRGPTVKPLATRDAIRVAIRNHARSLEFNRPQRIAGAVLVSQPPRVAVREGNYAATVDVLLQIDTIERYEIY